MRRSKFSKTSDQLTRERKSKITRSDPRSDPGIPQSKPPNDPPLTYQPFEDALPTKIANEEFLVQRGSDGFIKEEGEKSMTVKERIFDVVSNVIVADFFLILGFLLWFVVGISTQSSQPAILHTFQSIFQPVVVPSLTVLMVGSLASGLLNRSEDSKRKEEEDERGGRRTRR